MLSEKERPRVDRVLDPGALSEGHGQDNEETECNLMNDGE
jgi:hypothetical protein